MKKFERNIVQDLKDSAKSVREQMDMAYEIKREEIEKNYIPASVSEKLTPEEIRRSQTLGFIAGIILLLLLVLGVVWWFL